MDKEWQSVKHLANGIRNSGESSALSGNQILKLIGHYM